MKFHNLIIFDCETGGLDKKNNCHALVRPITQIALKCLNGFDLSEISRYESFIKGKKEINFDPEDPEIVKGYVGYGLDHIYEKQALKFTNITIDKLESKGKEAKEVLLDIIKFFEECKSGSNFHKLILVGHNVVYDIPFLMYLFKLFKKDASKYLQGYYDHHGNFQPVFFDTQFLSRIKSNNEDDKHNLTEVSIREGFELTDAHSAMNDALITSDIFKKYILTLRSNSQVSENGNQVNHRENFKFEY